MFFITILNLTFLYPLFCSFFEDDEPPCVEEIEYSTNCPTLKGTDLDSDINSNMAIVDEDEDGDGIGQRGAKQQQGSIGVLQQSNMKSCLFPDSIGPASIKTLIEKRNKCQGVSIVNGQITS